jgi:hypothetical protein
MIGQSEKGFSGERGFTAREWPCGGLFCFCVHRIEVRGLMGSVTVCEAWGVQCYSEIEVNGLLASRLALFIVPFDEVDFRTASIIIGANGDW